MLSAFEGNSFANLMATTAPASHPEMFLEVASQLAPHHKVKPDERKFREITIKGATKTHTEDTAHKKLAIRVVKGTANFVGTINGKDVEQTLKTGNWLYMPTCSGFKMTSGSKTNEYPCTFVLAFMQ